MLPSPIRALAVQSAALSLVLLFLAGPAGAQGCPDSTLSGHRVAFHAGQIAGGGQNLQVVAGGNIDLGACASVPGHGWVIRNPDFELALSGLGPSRPLSFAVQGRCDTVLLVHDPRGRWHYNDDAPGTFDPQLTIADAVDGTFRIWVGTYGTATCEAVLNLRTEGGSASGTMPWTPPAGVTPPPPATGTAGSGQYRQPLVSGLPVDYCLNFGSGCGQASADNFCRMMGFSRATSFRAVPAEHTLVLGDNRQCTRASNHGNPCHALADVVCGHDAPQPPAAPPPVSGGPVTEWPHDPGTVAAIGDLNRYLGAVLSIPTTGATYGGGVYGGADGVYAMNSTIAMAAVHAGILRLGQAGRVRVLILPGRSGYGGSHSNGIGSSSYGATPFSFRFLP